MRRSGFLVLALVLLLSRAERDAGVRPGAVVQAEAAAVNTQIYMPIVSRQSEPPTGACQLRPGDILTRDGWPITFMAMHQALYVGEGRIIDSQPPAGVQYRRLEDFADAAEFLRVHRLKNWSMAQATAALSKAVSYIDTPYDFDWLAGKDTEDRVYCSELVWRAYLDQGIGLDSNGGDRVRPGEVIDSPWLVEVCNLDPSR